MAAVSVVERCLLYRKTPEPRMARAWEAAEVLEKRMESLPLLGFVAAFQLVVGRLGDLELVARHAPLL